MYRNYVVVALVLILGLCGCGINRDVSKDVPTMEGVTRNIFVMNTYITIIAYTTATADVLAPAENRIRELESLLSVTDKNSEIYALNHSGGIPIAVSADTANVIRVALDMAGRTGGALDPTIYPVLRAWGFTSSSYRVPGQAEIDRLLPAVGYEKVRLSEKEVLIPAGMQIDLGAVAKGYTGDMVAQLLRERDVTSAIINLGGNVQTIGKKPDGALWKIGVKAPNAAENFAVLAVADGAVVTSGGYERYFTDETGKIYWHILDPSTGKPADSGLGSVTIVGAEGRLCDALSTALFVMGAEKAAAYWRKNGGFEMILYTQDNKIIITEGLEGSFALRDSFSHLPVTVIRP